MARAPRTASLGLLVVLLAGGLLVTPAESHTPRTIDIEAEDCTEMVPAAYSTNPMSSTPVLLETTVVLDGVGRNEAEAVVAKANEAYAPLALQILPTFKRLAVKPDSIQKDDAGQDVPGIEVTKLIGTAKTALGGERPTGSDLVYVMTTKDLYLSGYDDGVLGWAECIGGVRYPKRAFAAGEMPAPFTSGPLNFYIDAPAKVLAHELGHLLGARHDYGTCGPGIGVEDVSNREPAICSLMVAYVDLQSLDFGPVDSAVVRGHAEKYAAP